MGKVMASECLTGHAIHRLYEREAEDWRRPHLGASVIGAPCSRAVWYGFHWATAPDFDGRMLRLFERGRREEDWILEDLERAGIRVYGQQKGFSDFGGHFAGSCDGILEGIEELPDEPVLFECKTANAKSFRQLIFTGVEKAKPQHYTQMQVYMRKLELKHALYVCVNKDDDSIYTELVAYSTLDAGTAMGRARLVVQSPDPLDRISDDPDNFQCKFCDHREHCHLLSTDRIEKNCRTCRHSIPYSTGEWVCTLHSDELSVDDQKNGCDKWEVIHAMVSDEVQVSMRWPRTDYTDRRNP